MDGIFGVLIVLIIFIIAMELMEGGNMFMAN